MLCFVLGKHIASVITHVHRPLAEFCCYSQTRLNAQRAFDHAGTGTSALDTWAMIPTIMTTPPIAPGLELDEDGLPKMNNIPGGGGGMSPLFNMMGGGSKTPGEGEECQIM